MSLICLRRELKKLSRVNVQFGANIWPRRAAEGQIEATGSENSSENAALSVGSPVKTLADIPARLALFARLHNLSRPLF